MNKRIAMEIIGGVAILGLGILLFFSVFHRQEQSSPIEKQPVTASPVAQEENGEAKEAREIEMDEATIKKFGILEASVEEGKQQVTLNFNGEISMNSDRIAQIVPRLSGIVREVRKNLGDFVRAGEVVAVLESRDLADFFAAFRIARQRLVLAEGNMKREEDLYIKRISAQQDFLEAQNALASAQIDLQAAHQKLHALGYDDAKIEQLTEKADNAVTRYEMTAPFSATVIEKHINLGEVLSDDTAAFKIADLSTVWANLDVQQKDLPNVRVGQRITIIDGQNTPEITGQITYIEPTVTEQTRTVHARVVLPNVEGRWRPGLFVTARLVLEETKGIVQVPKDAVILVDGAPSVFVRTDKGFKVQPVKRGRTLDTSVEILDGLHPGQRYVAQGSFTLKSELDKPEAE